MLYGKKMEEHNGNPLANYGRKQLWCVIKRAEVELGLKGI